MSDEILNVNWLGTLIVCCIVVITSFHAARLAQVEIIYNIMNISLACIHLKAYKALYAVCSTPADPPGKPGGRRPSPLLVLIDARFLTELCQMSQQRGVSRFGITPRLVLCSVGGGSIRWNRRNLDVVC